MNNCAVCGTPIEQIPHRRERFTCSATCRSIRAKRRHREEYESLLAMCERLRSA